MRKNEQGFALVLSLVLMLAMSLMGGALIVISAGDHQSNNKSDEYQQTFYIAETALIEGEKYVLNQFFGPPGLLAMSAGYSGAAASSSSSSSGGQGRGNFGMGTTSPGCLCIALSGALSGHLATNR